jgi:hypothetical protein
MRDFDSELPEDRSIKIGGQVFHWRYPHWRDGALLFDQEMTEVQEAAKGADQNGDAKEFSFVADTETAIKRVPMFLENENDAQKRWKDLVARKTDPVPRHQIAQLYRYLVEVTSGFPTTQPSGSGSGDTTSEDSSTEGAS